MKKTYTKKQITEAISYWEKQLKKMNESTRGYIEFHGIAACPGNIQALANIALENSAQYDAFAPGFNKLYTKHKSNMFYTSKDGILQISVPLCDELDPRTSSGKSFWTAFIGILGAFDIDKCVSIQNYYRKCPQVRDDGPKKVVVSIDYTKDSNL